MCVCVCPASFIYSTSLTWMVVAVCLNLLWKKTWFARRKCTYMRGDNLHVLIEVRRVIACVCRKHESEFIPRFSWVLGDLSHYKTFGKWKDIFMSWKFSFDWVPLRFSIIKILQCIHHFISLVFTSDIPEILKWRCLWLCEPLVFTFSFLFK